MYAYDGALTINRWPSMAIAAPNESPKMGDPGACRANTTSTEQLLGVCTTRLRLVSTRCRENTTIRLTVSV